MAKKVKKNELKENVEKPKKKKMTAHQKRQLTLKIAGWIMAITMVLGSLLAIFGMLVYY